MPTSPSPPPSFDDDIPPPDAFLLDKENTSLRSSNHHNYGTVPEMETSGRKGSQDELPIPLKQPSPEDVESFSAIRETDGISLYDKKCMVVNAEIDRQGMGRYQWCVWALCGYGYLIDLLWAQAFGLVLSPLQQEFGFGSDQTGQITISFNAGLTAGAAFWGIAADVIGRKWAFNLTALFSSAFGLALGGSNNYYTFLILTAFVGFGVGGNIPIDTTITLEAIPQNRRRLLPLLSIFQPIGVVICTAIAYGFVPSYHCSPDWTYGADALPSCKTNPGLQPPQCCGKSNNYGWRYTLFTIGAITFACFFLRFFVFRFQESPKFLLYKGQDAKAAEVLQRIAKFNRMDCAITADTFAALETEYDSTSSEAAMLAGGVKKAKDTWKKAAVRELARYKVLFSSVTLARLTILVWLTYFADYWGFTLAGNYLPTIVSIKNGALHLTIKDTYRSYIAIYAPGIAGVILGVACYDLSRTSRKWFMTVSSGLMGASLFIFATVNGQASNIGLNAMEYFFQSAFNSVLYGYTPEAFPAPVRGSASGIASFWGRIAGITAPIAGQNLLPIDPTVDDYISLLYLAGGVTLGCVLFTALLPSKLVGQRSL